MRPGSFYTSKKCNEMIIVLEIENGNAHIIDGNAKVMIMPEDEFRDTFNSRAVLKQKVMKYEYLDNIYKERVGFIFTKNGNIEVIEKNYYSERSGHLDTNGKLVKGVPVTKGKPKQTSNETTSQIKYYIEYLKMKETELSIKLFDSKSRLHHIMNSQEHINISTLQLFVNTFKKRSDEITNGEQILLISPEDIWTR